MTGCLYSYVNPTTLLQVCCVGPRFVNKDEGRRRVTSGLRIQNGIPDDGENRTDTLPKNTNWESWKSCILRDKESELGG